MTPEERKRRNEQTALQAAVNQSVPTDPNNTYNDNVNSLFGDNAWNNQTNMNASGSSLISAASPAYNPQQPSLSNVGNISNSMTNNPQMPNINIPAYKPKYNNKTHQRASEINFSKGEVFNAAGHYGKTEAARELGISKGDLERRAKKFGFDSTEGYYRAYKAGKLPGQNQQAGQQRPTAESLYNTVIGALGNTGAVSQVHAQGSEPQPQNNARPAAPGAPWLTNAAQGIFPHAQPGAASVAGVNLPDFGMTERGLDPSQVQYSNYGQQSGQLGQEAALTPAYYNGVARAVSPSAAPSGDGAGIAPTGGIAPMSATAPEAGVAEATEGLITSAEDTTDTSIEQILASYDRAAAEATNQLGYLGNVHEQGNVDYQNNLSQLTSDIDAGKQGAYDTAKSTQRSNRNVLRSLGILSSSAAGEILSNPMVAAQKAAAYFDQIKVQKIAEAQAGMQQVQMQYEKLVADIQTDLRFDQRDQELAIQQATDALNGRIAEIQQAAVAWNQSLIQQRQQYAMDLVKIQAYSDPSLASTLLSQMNQG